MNDKEKANEYVDLLAKEYPEINIKRTTWLVNSIKEAFLRGIKHQKTKPIPALWEMEKNGDFWMIYRDDKHVCSFPEHFKEQAMEVFKILKNKD